MPRNCAPDERADLTFLLDKIYADPSPGPAERIYDEGAINHFRALFEELVAATMAADQHTAQYAMFAEAVQNLRNFVLEYNDAGKEIDKSLVYEFACWSCVDRSALSGQCAESFLSVFRRIASDENIALAEPIRQKQEPPPIKKRHKIIPGPYEGKLTYDMIIESARAEQEAHPLKRRPNCNDSDIIKHGPLAFTGLTWAAVDIGLRHGHHRLSTDKTLAQLLNEAGLPDLCTITHEMIVESARLEQEAHPLKRRPKAGDTHLIKHGPLAGVGLRWKIIKSALKNGSYHLPGKEILKDVLDEAGLPDGKTITHEMIVESARLEQEAHPLKRRPTAGDTHLIEHGPLAGMGLKWSAINNSLIRGSYHLPGKESLAKVLDNAGLPPTPAKVAGKRDVKTVSSPKSLPPRQENAGTMLQPAAA